MSRICLETIWVKRTGRSRCNRNDYELVTANCMRGPCGLFYFAPPFFGICLTFPITIGYKYKRNNMLFEIKYLILSFDLSFKLQLAE